MRLQREPYRPIALCFCTSSPNMPETTCGRRLLTTSAINDSFQTVGRELTSDAGFGERHGMWQQLSPAARVRAAELLPVQVLLWAKPQPCLVSAKVRVPRGKPKVRNFCTQPSRPQALPAPSCCNRANCPQSCAVGVTAYQVDAGTVNLTAVPNSTVNLANTQFGTVESLAITK